MKTHLSFWTSILLVFLCSANLSAQTDKKIILELFNATWCANCPDAAEVIENVLAGQPDVIPVALHFGPDEPMNTDESFQLATIFSGASAPGCMIDRVKFPSESYVALSIDEANISAHIAEREQDPVEVAVSLSNAYFNQATRELSVDVNATFLSSIELTLLHFNLWIVEDIIVSFDPAYEQTGPNGQISAYPHRYVLRKMLGDEWGTVGIVNVPSVSSGDSFSHTYTYTIPSEWNIDQLNIIGLMQKSQSIQNYDQRPILNASNIRLSSLIETNINEFNADKNLRAYPNPVTDYVHIDFYIPDNGLYKLKVTDVLGNTIHVTDEYFYNSGWQNKSIVLGKELSKELNRGTYYVSLISKSDVHSTLKLIKL